MASGATRSAVLYEVVERLRREGELREDKLAEVAGDSAGAVKELLLKVGFVREADGVLTSTHRLHVKPTVECVTCIAEYALPSGESEEFTRLMEALSSVESDLQDLNLPSTKEEADPEVAKKYVKDFIDPRQPADEGE